MLIRWATGAQEVGDESGVRDVGWAWEWWGWKLSKESGDWTKCDLRVREV